MTDEWTPATTQFPRPIRLTEYQLETIRADLWRIGITEDVLGMDPKKRHEFLDRSRMNAVAVYAAILHATEGTYTLTQSFKQWSRSQGLRW